MASNLQVTLEGKGPVTLRPSNHIATGGAGAVYQVGDLAVKMYLDPEKMQREGFLDRVKLLVQIKHPYVVAPQGLVLNSRGDPVGHYLPFVEGPPRGHPMSMVFTNDFWSTYGFDTSSASILVDRMREMTHAIHHGTPRAVTVDANELNWFALLMNGSGPEPRVIDVDSWAIGKFPASAIMPSIRDWNCKVFDESTDWFAFAVVTFQIYTGIHPYKGTLSGFSRGDMVGRMRANASVFAPGIKLNAAVRDFATIPGPLRDWYEATFQHGKREIPPSPTDKSVTAAPAARVMRAVVSDSGVLVFEKLFGKPLDPVTRTFHCGIALTASGSLIDLDKKREIGRAGKHCEVVRVELGWLVADGQSLTQVGENDLRPIPLNLRVEGRALISSGNRLFSVTERGLVEINVQLFGSRPIAAVGQTWGIMINSTRWFSGFGMLDAMGAMFAIVPFGNDGVAQVRLKELDGMKVVSGKSGYRFVSMIAIDKQGFYHKFELTFDKDYGLPPKIWQGSTDSAELNLAILPKGVCATIVKDEELDIFVPTSGAMKRVEDKQIATDMALANWKDTVVFVQNGDVWSLKLR